MTSSMTSFRYGSRNPSRVLRRSAAPSFFHSCATPSAASFRLTSLQQANREDDSTVLNAVNPDRALVMREFVELVIRTAMRRHPVRRCQGGQPLSLLSGTHPRCLLIAVASSSFLPISSLLLPSFLTVCAADNAMGAMQEHVKGERVAEVMNDFLQHCVAPVLGDSIKLVDPDEYRR